MAVHIAEWAPEGRMHPRLCQAFKMLRRSGVALTHILWQQGEAEANRSCNEEDVTAWIDCFSKMAEAIRTEGFDSPIYVARATICHGKPSGMI